MVCESRRPENKGEILENSNDAFECMITLYSFSTSKEQIDQVVSVILCKLAKKDIERNRSGDVKATILVIIF